MQPKEIITNLDLSGTVCECCGRRYSSCPHYATQAYNIDPAHAERIRARYAWAQQFGGEGFEETVIDKLRHNPLSTARSYADEGFVPIRVPRKINGDLLAHVADTVNSRD
jgi:hypothetical protein